MNPLIYLVYWLPLLPLCAALLIGLPLLRAPGWASTQVAADQAEGRVLAYANGAALLCLLLLLAIDWTVWQRGSGVVANFATWLEIDGVALNFSFLLDRSSLPFATLIALIGWITLRFSATYLHREVGFRRFFALLNLFLSGMFTVVLAGNLALALVGWELVGLSSWLLIGYAWARPQATHNALFVCLTQRIGDAAFILAIALAVWFAHSLEWQTLNSETLLHSGESRLFVLSLLIAALIKSAQLPFSPWLTRALDGPTPSSALFYGGLMIHLGVYLVLRLEPLLLRMPEMMNLLLCIGLCTALYAQCCGWVQSNVKAALILSTLTQVGLMFFFCGLGLFTLANVHLCLHAAWRSYQLLLAPSFLQLVRAPTPPRALPWLERKLFQWRWLYTGAGQGFWLEALAHNLLTRPSYAVSHDLRGLDQRVIDPLLGVPYVAPSPEQSQQDSAAHYTPEHSHGVAEYLLATLATHCQSLENHLLLRQDGLLKRVLQHLGQNMLIIEDLLEQPRYLLLMVIATFVVIL
ncbi:MAG: proton-conducting transporter membrane subunit [Pseudomonadota bacterium]